MLDLTRACQVFYVWFDAPIGYISITANYTPHWEEVRYRTVGTSCAQMFLWPVVVEEPGQRRVGSVYGQRQHPVSHSDLSVQPAGEIPAAAAVMPASLFGQGAKDNYTMLNQISTTEYLNYETGKVGRFLLWRNC